MMKLTFKLDKKSTWFLTKDYVYTAHWVLYRHQIGDIHTSIAKILKEVSRMKDGVYEHGDYIEGREPPNVEAVIPKTLSQYHKLDAPKVTADVKDDEIRNVCIADSRKNVFIAIEYYLLTTLGNIYVSTVSDLDPVVIRDIDDDNYVAVIMPMRRMPMRR
jgi:hypothetical protein